MSRSSPGRSDSARRDTEAWKCRAVSEAEGLDVQKIWGGVWDSHPGLISHAKEFGVYAEGTEKPKRGFRGIEGGPWGTGVGKPRGGDGRGGQGEEAGWADRGGQWINIVH